ncbi:lipid A-modifier LpxR family protein [Niabella aquatica]
MQYQLSISITALCILLFIATSAQNQNQFTIVSENDSYISVNNDGYYTNGIKLAYQWSRSTPGKKKPERTHSFYAGHNIYTAQFSGEIKQDRLDRPLTGYLYAGYQNSLYNEKEDLLKWGISAGVIGPPAYGAEVQKLAHQVMRIYKPTFWERQLNKAWGANADLAWSPALSKPGIKSKWAFKPLLSATAGTLFTHAAAGGALVYGQFNPNSATAFWGNHKGNAKANRELFGYLMPMVYLKAYDATVQGGMFSTRPEKIPGKLNPVFLQSKLGITYAGNRLLLSAAAIYESKQSLTQQAPQYYGSLQVGWLW